MARPLSLLQTLLEEVMEDAEEDRENVFSQPPTILPDPCIKFQRDASWVRHADNVNYLVLKRYQITVLDRNSDSRIPDLVEALPECSFDRWYAANGVNHWVYNIYF